MQNKKFSNIFWPILLIILGTLWMLSDLDVLPKYSLITFLSLWPLILVAVGLNILVGSQYPALRSWLAAGTLALALIIVIFAEPLGLDFSTDVKLSEFSEPLGETESAIIKIDLSVGRSDIGANLPGGDLFSAEIHHRGTASLNASQGSEANIHLDIQDNGFTVGINNFWDMFDTRNLSSNINISPDIPIDLTINVGAGEAEIDLSDLTLISLRVNGGVGEMHITLPDQESAYAVDVDGGVGEIRITIEDDSNVSLDLSGGVGNFTIDVPNDAAVRLDAEVGVGGINAASFLEKIQSTDHVVGQGGIWQSSSYSSSGNEIDLYFRGGVGSLTVR